VGYRPNWYWGRANVTVTGTQYVPSGGAWITNTGYEEIQLSMKRQSEAGSGALTVTIEEYLPTMAEFVPIEDGAGNAVTFLAYAGDETDGAGERQLLRIGAGVLGGDADGVLAIGGSETNMYEYTPPQYFRLKCVEAGTSSVCDFHIAFLRG
jgi:hypothetical protein